MPQLDSAVRYFRSERDTTGIAEPALSFVSPRYTAVSCRLRFSTAPRDASDPIFMELYCEKFNFNWLVIAKLGKRAREPK